MLTKIYGASDGALFIMHTGICMCIQYINMHDVCLIHMLAGAALLKVTLSKLLLHALLQCTKYTT